MIAKQANYITESRVSQPIRQVAGALFLCAAALSTELLADERAAVTAPLFTTAPEPEYLAELLFPPRYRSIETDTAASTEEPEFSMLINFRFDSTDILPESESLLQSLGEMLGMSSVDERSIVIEGHTDAVGDEVYNQKLSENRAKAIRQYLVNNYGIAPKRLLAVGKGERQLLASNDPAASVNRRASFRPARRVLLK